MAKSATGSMVGRYTAILPLPTSPGVTRIASMASTARTRPKPVPIAISPANRENDRYRERVVTEDGEAIAGLGVLKEKRKSEVTG